MKKQCAVLVVEDEPLIREELRQTLEDHSFVTYGAGDASAAIFILEANSHISVVFTDIQMPGTMDGVALAQYVRGRWPPTIIVVSSGKARPPHGALDNDIAFLGKPYISAQLGDVIRDVKLKFANASR